MGNLEDTARGILEGILGKRQSDQTWVKHKKTMGLLGIPLDQNGIKVYATLRSHIPQDLEKIVGMQSLPNRSMKGREIKEDLARRGWLPKANSTFHRWFDHGFKVGREYSELEVTLAYLRACIYQKKVGNLKKLGESNDG
jgi:hypothetical protein